VNLLTFKFKILFYLNDVFFFFFYLTVKMHFQASNQSNLNDDTIIQTSVTISLKDTHKRISVPVRGMECKHLNCFDLYTYLELNAEKNLWTCPICQKFTRIDMLQVDQYVWGICNELRGDIDEIIFDASGSYKPKLKYNKMDPLSPAEIQHHQQQQTTSINKQIKSPYQVPIPTPTHQSWQMSQPSPYNAHIASPFSPSLLNNNDQQQQQQQYAPNNIPISNPSTPMQPTSTDTQLTNNNNNNVDFQNPPSIGRPHSHNAINNLTASLPTPPTSSGSSSSSSSSSSSGSGNGCSSYTLPNTPLQSTNHSQMPPTPQSHSTQSQPSTPATPGAPTKSINQNTNQYMISQTNDLSKKDDDTTVLKQDLDSSGLHDLSDLNIDPADYLASDNVPVSLIIYLLSLRCNI
jgi:hypothetical protein